ncbi:PAS domain-containing protein [Laspinema olomoucense]|uniref:PAS domain-containing protein n=1 Tax=Laspinema olomoucense TaxID=3231600 RepID=UPI0021BB66B9|nr:PAS domain-containing protein [Laspinema sp. D3d]MCT7970676.1 PAS domain-containing protein [Laspinema sp. D3d]
MLEQSRSPIRRYSFAVAMVVVSLILKFLISSELMTNNPFLLFSATVAVSAWYGGLQAGLLATFLAAACGEYFFLFPFYSFGTHSSGQTLALGVFLLEGVGISWLISALYTSRQKAELYALGLENTQEQFRQIAENIDCLIWMTDPEKTKVFYVSPQYEKMWGRSRESLYQQPYSFLEGVHPEDRDRVRTALAKQASGEYNEEYRTVHPDGTVRWVRSRAFPIREHRTGAVHRVAGIVEDITERKQIEQDFLHTNERYQLASTAVNCVIYDWDLESKRVVRSESLTQFLGYPLGNDQQDAQWWLSLIHPDDLEPAFIAINKALEHDNRFDIEYRLRHQDGRYLNVSDRGAILRDEAGKPVRVIGTTLDISDRKKAETELQKREELFRTSVENLLDGFGIYTSVRDESGKIIDFRIEYVNAATCASNGLTREEHEGKRLGDLFPGHRTTGLLEEYCRVVETRQPLVKDSFVDETLTTATGVPKAFDIRSVPFGDGFLATWRDITERKQVENELYRREREFKALAENSPDIIARFDPKMRPLYVNRAIYRVTGRSPEQFLSTSNPELTFAGSQSSDCQGAIAQVFATGQEGEIEWDLTDVNGLTRYYQSRLVPEFDRYGAVESVLSLSRDITEYKLAKATSERNQERLRLALESAKLGLWDYDLGCQEISMSRRCLEIFGLDLLSTVIKYAQFFECVHPEDEDRVNRAIQRAITEQADYDIEYRIIRRDESVRWIAAKGRAFYDDRGTAVGMGGVLLDITERKKAEEERDRLLKQLEFEQQLLKAVLQQMPAGAIVAEAPSGKILLSNKQAQAIWDEAIAEEHNLEDYHLFLGLHPDGRPYQPQEFPMFRAITFGETIIDEEIEIPLTHGPSQILCVSAKPVKNLAGGIVAGVVMFYDISDRKLAERQREELLLREQEARRQAEAASRMKDEFLAIVSHELRSPLNAILGWSRLLRRRKLNPEKMAQALESIERNAEMQTQLIEDLLDISRIIRGKIRLYLRPLQLIPAIEAAINTVRPTAEIKKIKLVTALESEVGLVSADGDRLQQVIWNLLSNAVKFTPEGGLVEICLERVENWIQIRIMDTGIGIEPEFLPYMFERFRQADSKTTRSHGGLGLGLAIVRNLVELHGGQIFADSPGPGKGSTFVVQLPCLQDTSNGIEEQCSGSSSVECDQSFSELAGLKILVVDDEFDTREFLITALEQYGAEVFAAASSAEAIALIQERQPEILLSDIGMPGEDGYTLMRQIRTLPPEQGGKIPAAALTAYTRTEDRILALAAGFQMHIPKPIDPRHLVEVVGQLRKK